MLHKNTELKKLLIVRDMVCNEFYQLTLKNKNYRLAWYLKRKFRISGYEINIFRLKIGYSIVFLSFINDAYLALGGEKKGNFKITGSWIEKISALTNEPFYCKKNKFKNSYNYILSEFYNKSFINGGIFYGISIHIFTTFLEELSKKTVKEYKRFILKYLREDLQDNNYPMVSTSISFDDNFKKNFTLINFVNWDSKSINLNKITFKK